VGKIVDQPKGLGDAVKAVAELPYRRRDMLEEAVAMGAHAANIFHLKTEVKVVPDGKRKGV
jgi:hypothetical protein